MYEHKAVMDAGRERTFSPGESYDLPSVLAAQWVAAGVAVPVETPAARPTAKKAKERVSA